MRVSNQKPQTLVFDYSPDPARDDFDPIEDVRAVLVDPLFTANNPTFAVAIEHDDGTPISGDDVLDKTVSAAGEDIDVDAEDFLHDLYSRTLLNYSTTQYPAHRVFVTQAATANKMPLASGRVLYNAHDDVVPAAKQLIANDTPEHREQFFASVAFTYEPDTLGVAFMDKAAFDIYKAYLAGYISTRIADPNDPANKLANDFAQKISLHDKLTESILLRKTPTDEMQPLSFARLIQAATLDYARLNPESCFIMPFTTKQCFAPEHMVFLNVDAHAHALPSQLDQNWHLITASIANPVHIMSHKGIARLDTVSILRRKVLAQAANSQSNAAANLSKFNAIGLSASAPKPADIARLVKHLVERLGWVNRSENPYKKPYRTFMRPNRRRPDDPNVPGTSTITAYKPDIHLYVDTSGSISEDDYAATTKAMIMLARKLNVNLYFTSFSHYLSETSLIKARGCTAAQMWRQIQRIPKVSGGTDYVPIWHYINASKKRREELSLIITDFEYVPPSTRMVHPRRLYYVPCATMNYQYLKSSAENFIDAMRYIEPAIRQRLLF